MIHHSRCLRHGLVEQKWLIGWSDLKIDRYAFVCRIREGGFSLVRLTNAINSFQPQADESSRCTARRGRLCRFLFCDLLTAFCLLLLWVIFIVVDVNVCDCFLFHCLLGFVDLYDLAGLRPWNYILHAAARFAGLLLVLQDRLDYLLIPQLHIQRVLQQLPRLLSTLDKLVDCLFSVL